MDFKALKLLFFFALVIVQTGCASTGENTSDWTPDQEHTPTHDDSHGWGANLQGNPR